MLVRDNEGTNIAERIWLWGRRSLNNLASLGHESRAGGGKQKDVIPWLT